MRGLGPFSSGPLVAMTTSSCWEGCSPGLTLGVRSLVTCPLLLPPCLNRRPCGPGIQPDPLLARRVEGQLTSAWWPLREGAGQARKNVSPRHCLGELSPNGPLSRSRKLLCGRYVPHWTWDRPHHMLFPWVSENQGWGHRDPSTSCPP